MRFRERHESFGVSRCRRLINVAVTAAALALVLPTAPALAGGGPVGDGVTPVGTFHLDNGFLTFGGGDGGGCILPGDDRFVASISPAGTLRAPHYGVNGAYYGLTYNSFPLNFAMQVNDDVANRLVTNSSSDLGAVIVPAETDVNGTSRNGVTTGVGRITVDVPNAYAGFNVRHTYTLAAGTNFVKVDTTILNSSGSPADLTIWVGTEDDLLDIPGSEWGCEEDAGLDYDPDSPAKRRGSLTSGGAFTQATAATVGAANAVELIDPVGGSFIRFYSFDASARAIISDCCNFGNVVGLDPDELTFDGDYSTLSLEANEVDGSYGLRLSTSALANGNSVTWTWYYAGGRESAARVAAASRGPVLECPAEPVAVGQRVTVPFTRSGGEVDYLWNVSVDGAAFGGAAVQAAADGTGAFSFVVPAGAQGKRVVAELVEWSSCTFEVSGTALPTRLPAGEGPRGLQLTGLVALLGVAAFAARRLRTQPTA
jgi:hypothetical protein